MSKTPSPEANPSRTSRRALLAGAAAAAVAVAADAIAPAVAHADDGDTLTLGTTNNAVNTTYLNTKEAALHAVSNTDNGALVGENSAADGYGVLAMAPYIGVNAVGGEIGAYVVSDYGIGVQALTYDGVAVRASTAVPQGTALEVDGTARFSRSGRVTIPGGRRRATVPGLVLSADSMVLATLQDHREGLHVSAAVANVAAGTVTIHLNRATNGPVEVAWFVMS